MDDAASVASIRFTIHGKVQGVFFRKHTQIQGNRLGLRGWVMNTEQGTVVGEAHGPASAVAELSTWLSQVASIAPHPSPRPTHPMRSAGGLAKVEDQEGRDTAHRQAGQRVRSCCCCSA